MHLTNGTIQVNYFKDHTKLIVGSLDNRHQYYIVTFINSERQSRSWYLTDLGRRGATTQVRERMAYVASVLDEFAELDRQSCFK
jgi:polo-like kinase 1